MENILIQISNHPKFANRKREVCLLAENYNSGAFFVQENQLVQGVSKIEFGFKMFYFELIDNEKVYDINTRELFYQCSDVAKIAFVNNELKYVTDSSFPNFEYFPTEKDFVIDLKYTNEFSIAGTKYSLPKVSDGNGGERYMTLAEITALFIENLDTRESGSFFAE
jgi:hypothetical protein